jgi:hypothetical protein
VSKKTTAVIISALLIGTLGFIFLGKREVKKEEKPTGGVGITYVVISQGKPYIIVD